MSFFPNPGDGEVHLYVVEWGDCWIHLRFSHTPIYKNKNIKAQRDLPSRPGNCYLRSWVSSELGKSDHQHKNLQIQVWKPWLPGQGQGCGREQKLRWDARGWSPLRQRGWQDGMGWDRGGFGVSRTGLTLFCCFPIMWYQVTVSVRVQSGKQQLFIFQCMHAQSCLTLCNPMDCSPLGSSVHGILQTRILEWVAISSSRGSPWPRDWTCVCFIFIGRRILYQWGTLGSPIFY